MEFNDELKAINNQLDKLIFDVNLARLRKSVKLMKDEQLLLIHEAILLEIEERCEE